MFGFFKKSDKSSVATPTILGLRIGCSFELDSLMLKLSEQDYLVQGVAPTQIIISAGRAELDDTTLFRFYTDDDAFLQVVTQGGEEDHHVIDVKLFHYYDTLDLASQKDWEQLLNEKIGTPTYVLADNSYQRVWTAAGNYHPPVYMREETTDEEGNVSYTDQFTMLFERPIGSKGDTESLFLSAEETETSPEQLTRCLVISTGMTLSPANLTIHG